MWKVSEQRKSTLTVRLILPAAPGPGDKKAFVEELICTNIISDWKDLRDSRLSLYVNTGMHPSLWGTPGSFRVPRGENGSSGRTSQLHGLCRRISIRWSILVF